MTIRSTAPAAGSGSAVWLPALLMNGIPAVGVIAFGWSVSLILLLYWLENLVTSILWNRLIRRHESLTRLRGHYRNQLGVSSNNQRMEHFASEHFAGTIVFTLAHGVFLLVFAVALLDGPALLDDLAWVLLLSAGVVLAAVIEVRPLHRGLEQRSFGWLRAHAKLGMWPVMTMHVGVIFGGMALAFTQSGVALALVFIALRVLVDVTRARSRSDPDWGGRPVPPPPVTAPPGTIREVIERQRVEQYEACLRDEERMPDAEWSPR